MTTEYISLKSTTPVKEALMHVKEQAPDAETIYVIFAVNEVTTGRSFLFKI